MRTQYISYCIRACIQCIHTIHTCNIHEFQGASVRKQLAKQLGNNMVRRQLAKQLGNDLVRKTINIGKEAISLCKE